MFRLININIETPLVLELVIINTAYLSKLPRTHTYTHTYVESLFFLGDKVVDFDEWLSEHGFASLSENEELPCFHCCLGRAGVGPCIQHSHDSRRRVSSHHLRH